MMQLHDKLYQAAQAFGFTVYGFCDLQPFTLWQEQMTQRAQTGHGVPIPLSADPAALMPEARSILVLGMPYRFYDDPPEHTGRLSAYYPAANRSYHAVNQLIQQARQMGLLAVSAKIPAKHAAIRAGLGVMGRNGLLIHPQYGSALALQTILTDLPLPEDAPVRSGPDRLSYCSGCGNCVTACPVMALSGDGQVNATVCLRARQATDQPLPEDCRTAFGDRLFGCDTCQTACPHTSPERAAYPEELATLFEINRLLEPCDLPPEDVARIAEWLGSNYARHLPAIRGFGALVAGNSGNTTLIPVLRRLETHGTPAQREHARWAIQRLEDAHED